MFIKVIYGLNMVDQWWLVEGYCNRVNRLVMRSSVITNYCICYAYFWQVLIGHGIMVHIE
jgi:hypothetical protein